MTLGPVYNFFGGRATTFALVFTAAGISLAFKGHLDGTFVALVGAIQALVFAHSWKEDYMEWKSIEDSSKGENNVTR